MDEATKMALLNIHQLLMESLNLIGQVLMQDGSDASKKEIRDRIAATQEHLATASSQLGL